MSNALPSEPPPSYDQVVGSSSSSAPAPAAQSSSSSRLSAQNGISIASRRSMEDEARPLPPGWVRRLDDKSHHQFFVDTTATPPRSIWQHPYDDETYLKTLSSEERERLQETEHRRHPSLPDVMAMSSDEEDNTTSSKPVGGQPPASSSTANQPTASSSSNTTTTSSPRQNAAQRFGRRMKDKITNSTHEQRAAERARRAQQEQEAYERHVQYRKAMVKAMETGEPQLLGHDKDGRKVYVQPPPQEYGYGYGRPFGAQQVGYAGYGAGGYGRPGMVYARPAYPYQRPRGYGYGGGLGLPLAGGLLGGMALGGLMGAF